MTEAMASICRARLLSDPSAQTPCDKEATSLDGRLCAFHSRQCQAMYRGYKRRNLELDQLSDNPPPYLAATKTSIVVQQFQDVHDEEVLREIHSYIFQKYILLDRVIKARKLHHSHFFAIDMDYGHEKFLTKLQNDKHVMSRALERLMKRTAEVTHKKKEWLEWVQDRQNEEEIQRETESKKAKLEALLFKRHQKEMARNQQEVKAREAKKREEDYLQEAYENRLSQMTDEEQDDWDPIYDIFGYERENYVDLIKYFLMLDDPSDSGDPQSGAVGPATDRVAETKPQEQKLSKSAKKRAKKANAEANQLSNLGKHSSDGKSPQTIEMETKAQMRVRLQKAMPVERQPGWYIGDPETREAMNAVTHPLPDDEVEILLKEIAEIKALLLCRLLLSHAALLPVALRSNSIEEFLADEDVTLEHFRDICLKLERPSLQDVRDACADFVRGDDEDMEQSAVGGSASGEEEGLANASESKKDVVTVRFKKRLPDKFRTKREKASKKARDARKRALEAEDERGVVDFGDIMDEKDYIRKRARIRICGRYMYNYPSEKSLNRGGWYHFSVLAKDSSLSDAIELCRNWNEFFELNVLSMFNFFPTPKWSRFVGDLLQQQLLQLGFIPYFYSDKAEQLTHHFQTGSRGMSRRAHQTFEMRNFICGHIKRDDPVSRRFIQYLSMETFEFRALVRDPKTGRTLVEPPDEELWLVREKSGWGRATKHDFDIIQEIGPAFFEKMDALREWHFNFEEYYDVYVWDASPGKPYYPLRRKLAEVMARAIRVRELTDMFIACAPILKTVTREQDTQRVRTIRHGEQAESIWDRSKHSARSWSWSTDAQDQANAELEGHEQQYVDPRFVYTEADAIEDSLIFPDEKTGEMEDHLFRPSPGVLDKLEKMVTFNPRRWAQDLDSDEEISDDELESYGDDEIIEPVQDLPEDDEDADWDAEESLEAEYVAVEEARSLMIDHFTTTTIFNTCDPDYFLSAVKNPSSLRNIPEFIAGDPAELMELLRYCMRGQKVYHDDDDFMQADFARYLERQSSKVFKQSWHLGDLSSQDALQNYIDWVEFQRRADGYVMKELNPGPFELCKFLRIATQLLEEWRIVDDAFIAYASIAGFFETDKFLEMDKRFVSELMELTNAEKSAEDSASRMVKLFDQAERAKNPPDRRSSKGATTTPRSFWEPWDKIRDEHQRDIDSECYDIYPLEWRKTIRPVVINLFKAGIICSSYTSDIKGVANAIAEPGRPMDFYIDYYKRLPESSVAHLVDPTGFDAKYILSTASSFRSAHPAARFSILRIWSAPHFYPLMFGLDRRQMSAFLDDRGRAWEFKFLPKDMPYSEWSIHRQVSSRIEPYRRMLVKEKVVVAKDLILVMGTDEKECRRLSEGVTYAIQTKPWRMEVDFWRSFVGIDLDFLVGLDHRWLE